MKLLNVLLLLCLVMPLAAAAGAQWVGENDIGLGVNVVGWRQPFYASVAVMDAKARRTWPDFDSPQDGELLYVGEVGYERDEGGPNHAALRVAFSHIDLDDGANPQKGPGYALVVSGLRCFYGRFALFGRWTHSWNRESAKYQELLSVGTAWTRPFGRSRDFLGFGVWIGDPSDPEGLTALLERYLIWLATHNFADRTVNVRRLQLSRFILWCLDRTVTRPDELTPQMIERFRSHQFGHDGEGQVVNGDHQTAAAKTVASRRHEVRCEQHVVAFLSELSAEGLIRVV